MEKRQISGHVKGLVLAGTLGLAAAAWAQAHLSLTVNGAVASGDVRLIGGRPYVPLGDVARAYNQTLVKKPGGYELIAAGGAGQVGDAHTAKLGEELFTGQFRFKVTGVHQAATYTERYGEKHRAIDTDDGETLVIVDCRVKNGTKVKQELVFSADSAYGNPDTALTDDQEHSYAPFNWHGSFDGYDVHADEGLPTGAYVLPGAAVDFALVFSVPKGTHPKDLVYSLLKYGDRDHGKDKAVDVRVFLDGAMTPATPGDNSL